MEVGMGILLWAGLFGVGDCVRVAIMKRTFGGMKSVKHA